MYLLFVSFKKTIIMKSILTLKPNLVLLNLRVKLNIMNHGYLDVKYHVRKEVHKALFYSLCFSISLQCPRN